MADEDSRRTVTVSRTGPGRFRATNSRGGTLDLSSGDDPDFTPVELLLTAIAGCSGIDVDILTSRRSAPDSFTMEVSGNKVRDELGNHLDSLHLRFDVRFPEGEGGDAARSVLPDAVKRSHDWLCTVSRTVELESPVNVTVSD